MAVQGFGPGDFAAMARFAWKAYTNLRESRSNFDKLNVDVESLLTSIASLDKGHTQELILAYIDEDDSDAHRLEEGALREGLNSVVMPFHAIFQAKAHAFPSSNGSSREIPGPLTRALYSINGNRNPAPPPRRDKPWHRWTATRWAERLVYSFQLDNVSDIRSRFAVQAANLNLFLTRLTHTQLQRQTELLTLRLATDSLLRNSSTSDSLEGRDAPEAFRGHVARYVKYLLDGGPAISTTELYQRRKTGYSRHRHSSPSSTQRPTSPPPENPYPVTVSPAAKQARPVADPEGLSIHRQNSHHTHSAGGSDSIRREDDGRRRETTGRRSKRRESRMSNRMRLGLLTLDHHRQSYRLRDNKRQRKIAQEEQLNYMIARGELVDPGEEEILMYDPDARAKLLAARGRLAWAKLNDRYNDG